MPERGLLAVHAHPDDEVIMTGGVIAAATSRGHRAAVVTCTGGERGEVVGDGMDPDEVGPRLGEVRFAELEESLSILGAGEPRLLGYRDSGMMGEASNADPGAFWVAPFDEAVGRLVAHIRSFRPDVLVTYDAFGGYGHPDHIQAHRVAVVGVEAAAMPALYPQAGAAWRTPKVYLATMPRSAIVQAGRLLAERGLPSPFGDASDVNEVVMGVDDADIEAAVDVRPWIDQKWAALRAHRSQIGPDSFFLNVPADIRAEVFGTEWFTRLRGLGGEPVEADLFAGLE